MNGRDVEDAHTGGGEGSEASYLEGRDLRLNKAEMGSDRVQEDSNFEIGSVVSDS